MSERLLRATINRSVVEHVLASEWKEFRQPDFEEIIKLLNQPLIFDGRNQYDRKRMEKLGVEYYQIGVA